MKAFFLDEVPWQAEGYIISNNFNEIEMPMINTSYQLLQARLVGMTYSQYLDFCRECLGAQVVRHKRAKYASVYFKDTPDVKKFIDILNQNFNRGYSIKEGK